MEITNEPLFLAYAVPCAGVICKRGDISEADWEALKANKVHGTERLSKIFKVGYAMLKLTAMKMNKGEIDTEVIHEYFWNEHNGYVHKEARTRREIDPKLCKITPGIYLGNGEAELHNKEKRKVNITFTPKIKKGDYVAVHYGYVSEIIDSEVYKKLDEKM